MLPHREAAPATARRRADAPSRPRSRWWTAERCDWATAWFVCSASSRRRAARPAPTQDCGAAATNALAAMVRELPVACRVTGMDGLGRPFAVCQASGTELNSAVIAAGWARADTTEPELQAGGAGSAG